MATSNSINANSAGLVRYNGTGTFDGVTTTQYNTLVGAASNGITNISPGTSGQVLTSNGASADPSYQTLSPASTFAPNSTFLIYDDFVGTNTASGVITSQFSWLGSFVSNNSFVTAGHPGILTNIGFSSASNSGIILNTNGAAGPRPSFMLGGGAITLNFVFNIVIASVASPRYVLRMGMAVQNGGDPINGCYFEYSDNINSGNWVYKTAAASSRTTANSSIPVTTGWHNGQITINANASSISYSMDGVSLGPPIVATIPTLVVSPFFGLTGVSGTTDADSIALDLFYMTQTLTTAR